MGKAGEGSREFGIADEMFVKAWHATKPELERRARRLADGHRDRADDLLANTAIKALLFMRRSPDAMNDPDGFLFVVLRHVFLDSVRRNGRDGEVFDRGVDIAAEGVAQDLELSALQRMELDEQLSRVIAAVAALNRDQKRLFAYRFIDDLPYPAIAERLSINQPLARKRVQLLRERLRVAVERD